jgi:hypothetical protein
MLCGLSCHSYNSKRDKKRKGLDESQSCEALFFSSEINVF